MPCLCFSAVHEQNTMAESPWLAVGCKEITVLQRRFFINSYVWKYLWRAEQQAANTSFSQRGGTGPPDPLLCCIITALTFQTTNIEGV